MDVWSTDECNQYMGTEGTIFPALIQHGADIPSFAAMLCRFDIQPNKIYFIY